MHQIRRLRVRGYDQLGLRREAVFRLRPMGVQANKKIAAYAAGQQRLHQPGEHRHAHDPLQKHRPFIDRALALFTGDRAAWDKLAQQDMREDFSWRVPAKAYRALFASLHEG